MRILILLIIASLLTGCSGSSIERKDSTQYDKGSFNQLAKLDQDRMADYEIRENIESLNKNLIRAHLAQKRRRG